MGVSADLLHILSYLPKDLNFVNHTSHIGWREYDSLLKLTLQFHALHINLSFWLLYCIHQEF